MKRLLASLALLLALVPIGARADETSATLNALTLEQAIDCVTTMAVLQRGGYERDPLAAPFTHSPLTQIGAALALNLVARRIPVRILRTVVNVYPIVLIGNLHALSTMSNPAGMVPGSLTTGSVAWGPPAGSRPLPAFPVFRPHR